MHAQSPVADLFRYILDGNCSDGQAGHVHRHSC